MKGIKQDAQIVYERVTMLLDFLCEIISDATRVPPQLLSDIQDLHVCVTFSNLVSVLFLRRIISGGCSPSTIKWPRSRKRG